MHCTIYTRVSTDTQTDKGFSSWSKILGHL